MADNDDYMVAKATDDEIGENMWDRLQEGINANRRYRLKAVSGGDGMRYSSTKVVWDSDIYIFFTRESDGDWVYNKINTNPTTGITCDDNDLLYVTLSDTTTTVLTVSSYDYGSMPTDDTGRILILGGVVASTWYGNVVGGVGEHDNTFHSTNYAAEGHNLSSHSQGSNKIFFTKGASFTEISLGAVGKLLASGGDGEDMTWVDPYTDSDVEGVITTEVGAGQSIDNAIDALIAAHAAIAEHPGLDALDDRDFKPNTSGTYGTVRVYFTSLEGMTGTLGSDYQDLIIFNSYIDSSGGDINALTFDKSTKLIKHWLADQAAATWGTPEILAYVSNITTHTSDDDAHHAVFENLVEDETPQLYANATLDLNNGHISLNDTVVTSGKCTGIMVDMYNASGATRYFGDFIYISGTSGGRGSFALADASAAGTMPIAGMVAETVASTAVGKVLVYGLVYHTGFPALGPSATGMDNVIYASETAGDITLTAPTTANAIVQALGIAIHGDKMIFNPSFTTVKVST